MPTAQIPPTSEEFVLDQLSRSEEKLLKLLEELDGKDLNEVLKQMEEEEVRKIRFDLEQIKPWNCFILYHNYQTLC